MSTDAEGLLVRLSPIDPEEEWEPDEEPRLASESFARQSAQALVDTVEANQQPEYIRPAQAIHALQPVASELSLCLQAWDAAYSKADLKDQSVAAAALAAVLESIGEALDMGGGSQSSADDELLARTVRAITAVLAESISALARRELWSQAIELRGRYFRWWNHRCATLDQPGSSLSDSVWRERWIRRIGEQFGTMHAKGIVHGTALLESFDSGARARNFARTKYSSSSEERLTDLISFRYQVDLAEWNAFCDGYRQRAGDEANHRLATAEQLAPDTARPDTLREIMLPAGRTPAFCVRALSYALRNFSELAPILNELRTVNSGTEVEGIISSLQRSFGLAEQVTRAAAAQLLSRVTDLYTNGEFALAAEVAAKAYREAGHTLSAEEIIRLDLFLHLARGSKEDDAALAMARAAAYLIRLSKPECLQSAVHIAYSAIGKARNPATRGTCVVTCMEGLLVQAAPFGNPATLQAILDVVALAPEVTDEQQRILNKFEDVARRLLG